MRTRGWLGLSVLGACSDPLPSPSTVDVLRILALTTETPEVRPGAAISARAVWADPVGGRTIHWRWRLCDPGAADDPRVCARPDGATELASGEVDRVEVPAANLTLRPAETERTWVLYAIACPGADAVIDPGEARLVCPRGDGSEAFRRVTVRATAPLNRPPRIAAWSIGRAGASTPLEDGASVSVGSLAACDGDCPPLTLTLTPAPDAAEAFDGGAESLMASVYVGSGTVAPPRVVTDPGAAAPMVARWTPGRVVLGGEVARVWAVLRDQRGGEAVRAVTITAR
ncbi:MAG: hypothetical protein Q8S73_28545 [Deltaproteobacteria bacterium]|nr:hypothetical protein [Myxococcales bacterium]MDP3218089.1 hypothetical protein [Deltaproteobacteria bacterium]